MIPIQDGGSVYAAKGSAQGPRPTVANVASNVQPQPAQQVYSSGVPAAPGSMADIIASILMSGAGARRTGPQNMATMPPGRM